MVSNNEALLPELPVKPEYESLLTDFHKVEQIPDGSDFDAKLQIIDMPGENPALETTKDGTITARGDFAKLTRETADLRFSFFGNEGLVFRQTLKSLEEKYDIFSFHACAMYEPANNKIFLIVGGAGSGKSCFMLKGLGDGLQLLTAEMGHFSIKDGKLTFYKGALVDNIRIGNLKYNYPFILEKLDLKLEQVENEWGKKIPLDMNRFQSKDDEIVNPQTVIILPRVEQGRKQHFLQEETDRRKVARILFENASEKIGQSVVLYEKVPFVCLDTPQAAKKRLGAVEKLLEDNCVEKIVSVVSGPEDCWKNLV